MLSRTSASCLAGLGCAVLMTAAGTGIASAAVQDPQPIGPKQYFTATVDDSSGPAYVRTDCLGPLLPGQTGHPAPGQYVEAVPAPAATAAAGYTGSAGHALRVLLGTGATAPATVVGTLSGYSVPLALPVTATVPCSGSGSVTFLPQPAAPDARPLSVPVTFYSIVLDPPPAAQVP
jgi:hypothetical protein